MPALKPITFERFADWIAFEPMSGRWLWIGYRNHHDYGYTCANGEYRQAHRVLFELFKGPIPAGLEPDHLCRTRPCVNPDHLEPVTRRVNQLRGMGPAGINARKTHCINGHEYTPATTILRNKPGKLPGRECRTCKHAFDARRRRALGIPARV